VPQHRLVRDLDRGLAVVPPVGNQQPLIDKVLYQRPGVARQLPQKGHATLRYLIGALQPQQPRDESGTGEPLERAKVVRQAAIHTGRAERRVDGASDRPVEAAQAVAVLGQLEHTVGTVVRDQPLERAGRDLR
jgi:hypothetical protein